MPSAKRRHNRGLHFSVLAFYCGRPLPLFRLSVLSLLFPKSELNICRKSSRSGDWEISSTAGEFSRLTTCLATSKARPIGSTSLRICANLVVQLAIPRSIAENFMIAGVTTATRLTSATHSSFFFHVLYHFPFSFSLFLFLSDNFLCPTKYSL